MPLDWSTGGLAAGLACYRNQEFFEAHEHWEDVWNRLGDPERLFLQAIIHVTVAMHHYLHANRAGASRQLERALRKLDQYPVRFGGIDIVSLREEVRTWLLALKTAGPFPAAFPAIHVLDR